MATYRKYTDRMDIYIEEERKKIIIRQKWRYFWHESVGTSPWTYEEQKEFHNNVDRLIWNNWGEYFNLKATGNSDFAKKNQGKRWDVDFDIEWVLHSEHWKVNVTKYPSNHIGMITSSVAWDAKEIKLDTKDTRPQARSRNGNQYLQYPVVHEFGHAAGNSIFARTNMHGDEYKPTSTFYHDKNSLMNIGSELRDRHLDYILEELNGVIINTRFSIY